METVRKQENGYPKISEISEFISVQIRSVSILRDGNWKETQIWLSEISESVSVRIRSVSILSLGYIPKKGKKAFYDTNTVFVKKDGRPYCEKCKKMGHNEKNCTNNKVISFDSSYILMKDSKGCVSVLSP